MTRAPEPVRLAVLADVHGNLAAFEAALEAARRSEPDLVVVAGDVVNGAPDSRACWELARAHADVLLRGNHERYVFDRGTPQGDAAWTGPRFRPLAWTAREMAGLEPALRELPIAARPASGALVVHAVPDDDATSLYAWSSDDEVERAFRGHHADLIVRAHNHLPYQRTLADGRLLVSVGAVGLSLVGRSEAQWGLFTRRADGRWHVAHRSEPYDVAATVRRFHESGYLDVAGPVGELFLREAATGTHHLVPFFRFERAWRREQPPARDEDAALAAAVDAYLGRGRATSP